MAGVVWCSVFSGWWVVVVDTQSKVLCFVQVVGLSGSGPIKLGDSECYSNRFYYEEENRKENRRNRLH